MRLPSIRRNRLAEVVASAGGDLSDLTCSNPTQSGLTVDDDALLACFEGVEVSRYAPDPRGLPRARQALAEHLGGGLSADRLFLCASTSEAYSLLFKLLCAPGDAVAVPQPSYPLFEQLTALEGVRAAPYRLRFDGSAWRVDLQQLREVVSAGARAVMLVNPNNPTGSFVAPDELRTIDELCAAHGAAVIGDEVFADYPVAGIAPTSVADACSALTFALGGLSKSAGLPQMKLAWVSLHGDEARRRRADAGLELICDTFLSVNTLVQAALPRLLAVGREIRDAIRRRIAENRASLAEVLASQPACSALPAQGGWSVVIRVPALRSEEALVLELVEQHRVLVFPGYFFDFDREAFVVVSLLIEPSRFRGGMETVLRVASTPRRPNA